MKRAAFWAIVVLAAACTHEESPPSVSPTTPEISSVGSAGQPVFLGPLAASGPREGREVTWGRFFSGVIKNTTEHPQHYDFCAKNRDTSNKKTASADVGPGQSFAFDLGVGCVQADITQNGCGPTFLSIEHEYYNSRGEAVHHSSYVDWGACEATPPPTCVEQPTITYTEWGECRRTDTYGGQCSQDRVKVTTYRCKNSTLREEEMRYCECPPKKY